MTYLPYITRALTLVLGLSLSHTAGAQSDSAPITDDEIANAVAQYEALLAEEQALVEQAIVEPIVIEAPIIEAPIAEDAPLENLWPEDTPTNNVRFDTPPFENVAVQDEAIIDMASFREITIAQAKANGATAQFILNTEDSSQFQTLHEGLETDFHLTNVYQDCADNPEVSLDTAIDTIVFLIMSAETHRFIAPDEAVAQPWLIETPESATDVKTENLPLDVGVDLLPGHTE